MLERWTDPAFLAEAHAWVRAHVSVTGEIEQPHVRQWSTVMRVPTAAGDVWFKANTDALQHEAAVVRVLAEERPDAIPPLVALDVSRGWLLMQDAGERLREVVARERRLERWLDILSLYAGVQLDLAPRAEELVALGVPDLRLAVLPAKFEAFLDVLAGELDDDLVARLRDRLPWIHDACAELASYGIPETIQHDDLHDGQVFVRDGRYLVMDWGDACVSHPFYTLSVTLEGFIAWGVEDVEQSEDVVPYRDAYLAQFSAHGSFAELSRACDLALRLGWICRSVNAYLVDNLESTKRRLEMF